MDVTDAVAGGRQRAVGLPELLRVPTRRWPIVLAVTVLFTLAGAGYLLLVPARYTATCVVVVRPVVIDPFTYPSGGADRAVNMAAENGVATSNEVIDQTAAATGRPPDDVRDRLEIETPVGGQILRFAFVGASGREAVAGANAAAATYLKVRAAGYENQRAALLKSYDASITSITAQRKAAQKGLPRTLDQNTAAPGVQAVLDQLRGWNEQLAQLAQQRVKVVSADLSPGAVTAAARAPVPSSHDAGALYLLAAVLGGILAGGLVAYAREAFDRRIRSVAQAGEVAGLPVLGVVRTPRRRGAPAADGDYRYVALAAAGWLDGTSAGPLVVLSSRADEGRSRVAAGLSVALAETGRDVYLGGPAGSLDELREVLSAAQRRRPAPARVAAPLGEGVFVPQQRLLVNQEPDGAVSGDAIQEIIGLTFSTVVDTATERDHRAAHGPPGPDGYRYGDDPWSAAEPTGFPGDGVGPVPERPAAGTVRLGRFERPPPRTLVVIDAPPAETDERGVAAARSGTAVLVVALDRSRTAELARLADRLRAAGVRAIGLVVTGGRSG
ncbi:MAG TPA: Wzz/FepE/Etk N-terminal domain-containing protein [Catenuloplanes sp.]|jgi:capsular polysaccharide biosynthesis protein